MINYNVVAENIVDIAKERKIKIKELEDSVGVSNGYFSRFTKLNQASGLKLELLFDIAKFLHTSVDYVVNYKDRMLSEDDKRVVNFLDCIAMYIREYKPLCEMVTLNYIQRHSDCQLIDEIFYYKIIKDNFPGGDVHENFRYLSKFVSQFPKLEKIIYDSNTGRIWTDPKSDAKFLITRTMLGLQSQNGVEWYGGFEMYMENEGKVVTICNAYRSLYEKFFNQLEIIYGLVSEGYCNAYINDETRSFIDDYIKMVEK